MKRNKPTSINDIPASSRRRIVNRIIEGGAIQGVPPVQTTGRLPDVQHGQREIDMDVDANLELNQPTHPQADGYGPSTSKIFEGHHEARGTEAREGGCGLPAVGHQEGFDGHHFLPADDVVNAQGQPAAHHQAAVFETGHQHALLAGCVVNAPVHQAAVFEAADGVAALELEARAPLVIPELGPEDGLIPRELDFGVVLPDIESPEPSEAGDEQLPDAEDSDDDPDNPNEPGEPGEPEPQEHENEPRRAAQQDPGPRPDPPLYQGCPVTLGQSMIAILTFALVHSISGSCLADLLVLVHLHCLTPNLCKTTLHLFNQYFKGMKSPVQITLYCSKCFQVCQRQGCNTCGNQGSICYLLELPIIPQLQRMFKRDGFYDSLRHRFSRTKLSNDGIEDIYDGYLYQRHMGPNGFLRNRNNISFTWYSDGAAVFKSSKLSIWPLFLSVNELPYRSRLLKENVVMCALWCGPVKPPGNLLLGTLLEGMNTLSQGVDMELPNNEIIFSRAMLLCGTCDGPARAMFLQMNSHSGYHSCPRCLIAGVRVANKIVFPYFADVPARTDDNMKADAAVAKDLPPGPNGQVQNHRGVKGPTVLSNLVPNFVESTAIDIMHLLYLNVFKKLLKLWFDPSCSTLPCSKSVLVSVVDNMIKKLKLPANFSWQPRDILKHLAYWKAKEFKNMFHIYALPVLEGVLGKDYFEHFVLLVVAISLLTSESVSFDDVHTARILLHEFVRKFPILYHIQYATLNVHMLLHLPDQVLALGPLQMMACFGHEGLNGDILNLVNGTRYVHTQIASAISVSLQLPIIVKDLPEMSLVKKFCSALMSKGKRVKYGGRVADGIFLAGKGFKLPQMPYDITEALHAAGLYYVHNVKYFSRLQKGNLLLHSEEYKRCTKSDSTCALVQIGGRMLLCKVRLFVNFKQCVCDVDCDCGDSTMVIARKLNVVRSYRTAGPVISYFTCCHEVHYTNELFSFDPSCVKRLCAFMKMENKLFVGIPSMSFEYD